MSPCLKKILLTAACAASALLPQTALAAPDAHATPTGFSLVAGQVDAPVLSGANNAEMTIRQTSQRAIIDWDRFDIGSDAQVTFDQLAGVNAVSVNRVTGAGGPTEILGRLSAPGTLVVLDRNGVIFRPGARIDTAGIIASTGDIADTAAFMAGQKLDIHAMDSAGANAAVINEGIITVSDGGLAALVAPVVRNSGSITAHMGTAALASGRAATIDFYGDRLVSLALTEPLAQTLGAGAAIENTGILAADAGTVQITARAGRHIVDTAINLDGIVQANTMHVKQGRIVLDAGADGHLRMAGTVQADHTRITAASADFEAMPQRDGGNAARDALSGDIADIYVSGLAGLQQAVWLARETGGSTIHLASGSYTTNIVIDRSLTLQGTGTPPRLFARDAAVPVIQVIADNVTLAGLSLRDGAVGVHAAAVRGLHIIGSLFTGFSDAGAVLDNAQDTRIEQSLSFGNSGDGLRLSSGLQIVVQTSVFYGNGGYGLQANGVKELTLSENAFFDNALGDLLVTAPAATGGIESSRSFPMSSFAAGYATKKTAQISTAAQNAGIAVTDDPRLLAKIAPAAGGGTKTGAVDCWASFMAAYFSGLPADMPLASAPAKSDGCAD